MELQGFGPSCYVLIAKEGGGAFLARPNKEWMQWMVPIFPRMKTNAMDFAFKVEQAAIQQSVFSQFDKIINEKQERDKW